MQSAPLPATQPASQQLPQQLPQQRPQQLPQQLPPQLPQQLQAPFTAYSNGSQARKFLTNQDNRALDEIIGMLRRLQSRTGMRMRFHLLMESEIQCAPQLARPPTQLNRAIYQVELHTDILYSPTMSLPSNSDKHRKLLHNLISTVNELSFLSMNSTQLGDRNGATPQSFHMRHPSTRPFPPEDEGPDEDEDLPSIEPFIVPYWFPFQLPEYTSGLPASRSEHLVISEDIARKFDSLPSTDICNLYRTFFEMLHSCAKQKKRDFKQRHLKYSMFTPPWIRSRLIVGGHFCLMPKLAIEDQRKQRNKQGYKRMAWILSAFYEKERCFGRNILEYLLRRLPALRKERNERNESRKVHTAPLQRALARTAKRPKQNPLSFNRRTRRRLEAPQIPEPRQPLEVPAGNSRNNHESISLRTPPTPQANRPNSPEYSEVEQTRPTTSIANDRESPESTNEPNEAPTSEDDDMLTASGQVAKKGNLYQGG